VDSVVAGIYNAATPLMTLLFLLALVPAERPTGERILALFVGFVGVLIVLGPWDAGSGGPVLAQLACLAAAGCYGIGFAYLRRFVSGRPDTGVALAAAQLSWATIQLAPSPCSAGLPGPLGADVIGSMLALGALGSGVAYVLNFRILRAVGPSTASSVTYLIPLFSTAFGILLLGEALTWHQPGRRGGRPARRRRLAGPAAPPPALARARLKVLSGGHDAARTAGATSVPSSSTARSTSACGMVPTLRWSMIRSSPSLRATEMSFAATSSGSPTASEPAGERIASNCRGDIGGQPRSRPICDIAAA
jgi:hypothetical protein